jgi:hypothetical protein
MAIADKRLYAFRINTDYSSHFMEELFEDMTDHDVEYIKRCQKNIDTSKFARSIALAYIRTPTKTHLSQAYKNLNGDYDE